MAGRKEAATGVYSLATQLCVLNGGKRADALKFLKAIERFDAKATVEGKKSALMMLRKRAAKRAKKMKRSH